MGECLGGKRFAFVYNVYNKFVGGFAPQLRDGIKSGRALCRKLPRHQNQYTDILQPLRSVTNPQGVNLKNIWKQDIYIIVGTARGAKVRIKT